LENTLKQVTDAMDTLIRTAISEGIAPNERKVMRRYNTSQACQMLGKSTTTLYKCEEKGVIDKPAVDDKGRRVGYSLDDIAKLRDYFGTKPTFTPKSFQGRMGITVALYNFKGGVGKSTTAVCMAQHLAILGHKVLLIDMDSQASATAMFGYMPDIDIDADDTVLPYTLYNEQASLKYAVRETHIANLYLIPANQQLSSSEFEALPQVSGGTREEALNYFHKLQSGINTIKDQFDFVIVDAPPSLGIVGIQTLLSVDNIIIPCPARMLDFVSTRQFLETATEYVKKISDNKTFNSVKVMVSMFNQQNTKMKSFVDIMELVLGEHMYENKMLMSESIDDTFSYFKTPFELAKLKDSDKRIIHNMKVLFGEICSDLVAKGVRHGKA